MTKKKIVVIGGGWAGCAAALTAEKAGADVTEKVAKSYPENGKCQTRNVLVRHKSDREHSINKSTQHTCCKRCDQSKQLYENF